MLRGLQIFALFSFVALPSMAQAAEWRLQAQTSSALVLTYAAGDPVSYRFECIGNEVRITETGVTKLLNLGTGTQIADDPQAVMPAGSAMMALFTGKGEPDFVPAEAVKNPVGGWDLTIRLPKNDKRLKAIGKSEMMSLFTTGYTMAVTMDDTSRAQWNDFMQRCKAQA